MSRFVAIIALLTALVSWTPTPTTAATISTRISFRSGEFEVVPVGDRVRVEHADGSPLRLMVADQPDLPYRIVRILLPVDHQVVDYSVLAESPTTLAEAVNPTVSPPVASEDGKVGKALPAAMTYSPEGARYLGTGYVHGYAIASFAVFPVAVQDGRITLSQTVNLNLETGPTTTHIVRRQRVRPRQDEADRRRVESLVVNPSALSWYGSHAAAAGEYSGGFQPSSYPSLEGSPVDYVIVTTADMAASYQVLADWKTDKGMPSVVRTVEWISANYRNGSDLAETVRNFAIDAYQKWGIRYLLLGGDTDQVPARMAWSGFYDGGRFLPVDMYFGCLDGDWNADGDAVFGEGGLEDVPDLYSEVFVGRLPTPSAADAAIQIGKIISYESPSAVSYANRILLLGEVLFPYDWEPGQTITLNGAELNEKVYNASLQHPDLDVVRQYQTDSLYVGSVSLSAQSTIDSINAGFDHVVHVGHGFRFNMSLGDRSMLNADADALINGDRLCNLYLLNCTAVAYTYYCLGEHFLRNPNGGAVSVIGASESAYPNASSFYMEEYYSQLFDDDNVHIGEAFAASREKRTPLAILGDNIDLYTHYIYALLGDPEMSLWTGELDDFVVSLPDSVVIGSSTINVGVMSGGFPADSAVVCLTKGEDDYQIGVTDGAGQVSLDFVAESVGEIRVVVTGLNRTRYTGTIPVVGGSAAYVSLHYVAIDDDSLGATAGNGDGIIDAGETADLIILATNTGAAGTGNVDFVLRSSDSGVTIIDSTAAVGTMPPGGISVALDPVGIYVDPGVADETAVRFELVFRENGVETWHDHFTREVRRPELSPVNIRIDDSASGNGDGVADAGEAFHLFYGIKNFGTGACTALNAELIDLDGAFVFTDSVDSYPPLASMGYAENVNGFLISESDISTEHRLELVVSDTYGRVYRDTLELRPPEPPGNLQIDPRAGADRLQLTWDASVSADVTHYNVYRSQSPGGTYILVNVDPVVHPTFLDVGLSPATSYYYVLKAIDDSGNGSAFSAEVATSTNHAQMMGWPIPMSLETSSSPVVGDIDADGRLEIIQGNQAIYAWRYDGTEMVDGDNDPHSWGVLNNLGNSYVSHIALARLDDISGLEIIAASRNTKEVFVLDNTGTPWPGWPQSTQYAIRAGIAIGDVDGDDQFEIIAVDERGVMYVWNPDGSEVLDGDSNPVTNGVYHEFPGCTFQYSTPAVVDIDSDGSDEIIIGTQGDEVYILDDDGSIMPGWPFALGSDVAGSVAVGDIDGNGDLEIIVNTLNGWIWALKDDASPVWSQWYPNNLFFGPSPALGDLTGNGKLETIVPGSNGSLYVLDYAGASVPGWPVQYSATTYTESSPLVADITGDGGLDVILGDESKLIRAWDAGGNPLAGFPLAAGDAIRGVPAIADLDADGDVDLVASSWDKNVYVWDLTGVNLPGNAPWSSFHANHHNNGVYAASLVTAVSTVSFGVTVGDGIVDVVWHVPGYAGHALNVNRTRVDADRKPIGESARVTTAVVGPDGMMRVIDRGANMGERYLYRIESLESGVTVHTTGVIYVPVTKLGIDQNYPNPFNPSTSIDFYVPEGAGRQVSLIVYDTRGARVRTLVDASVTGGKHSARWDGRNDMGQKVGSGVYFCRMTHGAFHMTRKMMLLK